jgi:hypothetical protein
VIAVSDATLAKELDEVKQTAGEAVLHDRTPAELKKAAGEKATASTTPWINQLTEDMRTHAKSTPSDEVIHSEDDGHAVLGGRVKATGWLLIWKAADN